MTQMTQIEKRHLIDFYLRYLRLSAVDVRRHCSAQMV